MKALLSNVNVITNHKDPVAIDHLAGIFYAGGQVGAPLYRLRRGSLERITTIVRVVRSQGVEYIPATEESLPVLMKGGKGVHISLVSLWQEEDLDLGD